MQAVDQGPTGLDYITLIIAVFGAVLGAAAFVWQIASFKMSGPRIVVRLAAGWIGPSGALVFEVQDTWEPIDRPNENFIEECFAVQVHNAGRMPASITGWWLQIGPASLGQHVSPWNKPCPHRLEAYAEETWFVDRDQVLSVAQALTRGVKRGKPIYKPGQPVEIRAAVSIGGQESKQSKNSTKVPGRAS